MGSLAFATGGQTYLDYLFRATAGGTVFNSVVVTGATDLFDDAPAANDAIYFGISSYYMYGKINFNITTALVGTDVVLAWEYYGRNEDGVTYSWRALPSQKDDTNGFTTLGANAFWTGLPYNSYPVAVGGVPVSYWYWVRCRLVSFTTISEGGRTDSVRPRDATLYITGYTDLAPCTLEEIYQYMKTNYPYLTGITKIGGFHSTPYDFATYDFREINFWVSSRLLVKNEGFHQGCGEVYGGGAYCGRSHYAYLTMGTKIGSALGSNGGWLIHHSLANTYPILTSSQTRIYNSLMKGKGTGYIAVEGEWHDNIISLFSFNPYLASKMNNNLIETTLWLLNGMPVPFDGNKVVLSPRLGFFYNMGFTLRDLDYELNGTTAFMQMNNCIGATARWVFVDPLKPLPINQAAVPRLMDTYCVPRDTFAFSKVWFHDVSAGTYIDYTTECSDGTPNNMPLHGDIGDCYYFGLNGTMGAFGLALRVVANMLNDYGYVFEKYISAVVGWEPLITQSGGVPSRVLDSTNNFSNNGLFYSFAVTDNTVNSVSINGVALRYVRLRIVEKGTTVPMLTQILYGTLLGSGDWHTQVKYTLALTIINEENVPIENARVLIKYNSSIVADLLTDADGAIVSQELLNIDYYFVPFSAEYGQINTDTYNEYEVSIQKEGYAPYITSISMNKKQDNTIALTRSKVLGQGRLS